MHWFRYDVNGPRSSFNTEKDTKRLLHFGSSGCVEEGFFFISSQYPFGQKNEKKTPGTRGVSVIFDFVISSRSNQPRGRAISTVNLCFTTFQTYNYVRFFFFLSFLRTLQCQFVRKNPICFFFFLTRINACVYIVFICIVKEKKVIYSLKQNEIRTFSFDGKYYVSDMRVCLSKIEPRTLVKLILIYKTHVKKKKKTF